MGRAACTVLLRALKAKKAARTMPAATSHTRPPQTPVKMNSTTAIETPTFEYRGNIASFNPSKRVVSLLFHRGAEIPGDHPRLEGDGRLARTMRFTDLEDVEAGRADLEAVIRAWCDWKAG